MSDYQHCALRPPRIGHLPVVTTRTRANFRDWVWDDDRRRRRQPNLQARWYCDTCGLGNYCCHDVVCRSLGGPCQQKYGINDMKRGGDVGVLHTRKSANLGRLLTATVPGTPHTRSGLGVYPAPSEPYQQRARGAGRTSAWLRK